MGVGVGSSVRRQTKGGSGKEKLQVGTWDRRGGTRGGRFWGKGMNRSLLTWLSTLALWEGERLELMPGTVCGR